MTDKTDLKLKIRDLLLNRGDLDPYPLGEILRICIESDEAREYWKQQFVEQACEIVDNKLNHGPAFTVKQAIRDKFE